MIKTVGIMLLLVGLSGLAGAITQVPEISLGSGGNALALLSGALLIIRGRQKK